jgi:hypothetical protein
MEFIFQDEFGTYKEWFRTFAAAARYARRNRIQILAVL